MDSSRCLVAHHNRAISSHVSDVLQQQCAVADVRVVARGEEALVELEQSPADVLLVGATLALPDPYEIITEASDRWPGISTMLLSPIANERVARKAFAAGASAFVSLETEELPLAMEAIRDGRTFIHPALASDMLFELERPQLTDRERQVLLLVSDGYPTSAISVELGIAPETIKSHVTKAMRKLGATTRSHAVAICLRSGVFE